MAMCLQNRLACLRTKQCEGHGVERKSVISDLCSHSHTHKPSKMRHATIPIDSAVTANSSAYSSTKSRELVATTKLVATKDASLVDFSLRP